MRLSSINSSRRGSFPDKRAASEHCSDTPVLVASAAKPSPSGNEVENEDDDVRRNEQGSLRERLRRIAAEEYEFIWRSLRRLGVRPPETDDAAQQVFVILSPKLASVEPGKERSYLFSIVMRVASGYRRRQAKRREVSDEATDSVPVALPSPEVDLDRAFGRAILDDILARMSDERRAAFVLVELEELTLAAAAEILNAPIGTVASRVARAREELRAAIVRLHARGQGV